MLLHVPKTELDYRLEEQYALRSQEKESAKINFSPAKPDLVPSTPLALSLQIHKAQLAEKVYKWIEEGYTWKKQA